MNRRIIKRIVLIALCVVILTLLLLYIPRTKTLDYDMTGYIIQPDGEVIEQFNFTITGKEYDFIIDGLKSGRISFSGDKLTEIGRDAFVMYFDWGSATFSEEYTFGYYVGDYHPKDARFIKGELNYYNGAANDSYFETGILDLENGTFCMYADNLVEDAFVVGVSDPNTDPMEVIARYQGLKKGSRISWDTTGTFVQADGTTEPVPFAIDGYINDTPDDVDELFITFKLSDNFRYLITTPKPSFVSMNQKHNDLPHLMICPTYIYNKTGNQSFSSFIALDLEERCAIVLFGDAPDCYLVASQDSEQDYNQLLEHFADFIEAYGPHAWEN